MPLTNIAVAEEALSLSPSERVELAKLLIQSVEGDSRTDEQIKVELDRRLEDLLSGKDPGLTFDQVFGSAAEL
jgi:putative addiction module component (TIGR02574 family)